jgi:hypothetical protein
MTRDETIRFLAEVNSVYPSFCKGGPPDVVIDAWKDVLKWSRPQDATQALKRHYAAEDSRLAWPTPAQLRKLLPGDAGMDYGRDAVREAADKCPYCIDGRIWYFEEHLGAEYEYMLDCVCLARSKGAPEAKLRRLSDLRDAIRAAGKLKYGDRKWPPAGDIERFDDDYVPF